MNNLSSIAMNIILKTGAMLMLAVAAATPALAQPPQPPAPVLPAYDSSGVLPNAIPFQWSAVSDAFYYRIQIARNPHFTGLLDVDQTNLAGTEYTFLQSVINNPPEATAEYFWRVAAGNTYGEGSWSPTQRFRTGFPDGQAVVMRFYGADTSLAMTALNSRDYWDARYLYSKVKTLRRDTTALYRQEDFPYLYIEPFVVRRIDFLRAVGKPVLGHLNFDYRFSDVPPFGARTDLLVYFHPKRAIPRSRYPLWNYYADGEIPVTAMIPPGGKLANIDTAKIPVLLVHGAGYTAWGNVPAELMDAGYDVWQWLYPAESPVDSSAALLGEAMKRLAALYGSKKIGIAAHGTGGLVARAHIQSADYAGNIGKLLMLGTPNHGSYFAYKLAYTEEFTATGGQYVRRFDRNSPLWRDAAPGSDVLARINAQPPVPLAPSGFDPASTYLCVAGLSDMPLGWPHTEVAGYDDGVSAMQSVSMLDKNLPFATVMMQHAPGGGGRNLLENSGQIIAEFMSETYSPRPPSQRLLSNVESFMAQIGYVVKPDNRLYESPGIEIWDIHTMTAPRLSVIRDKAASTLTLYPEGDALETNTKYGMIRNPSTGRYFSVNRTGEGGIGWDFFGQTHAVRFADYVRYPVDKQATSRRRRAIPVSASPVSVRIDPMQTAERMVRFRHQIAGAWLTGAERRHELYIFPENPGRTAVRDTLQFRIDPYMDTMLVIATPLDNALPLQPSVAAGFTLIAPNGMTFDAAKGNDSTIPQYTAGGSERFAADGAAYFFMARPMPGIWSVVCNTSAQPVRFLASFLSDLSLRIVADDSVFSVGDSVHFAVVLPNYFFNDVNVRASLYYDTNPDSSALGIPLDLVRDIPNPAVYRGGFVPPANGMYYIRAEFSAQFPESRISRTAFHAVEVADALPEQPRLLFPLWRMTEVPRNTYLAWQRDLRARSFRVQLARDFWFDTLLVDLPAITDTSLMLPNLAPTTVFYWRVQAKNARGTTAWSDVYSFSTGGKALGVTPLLSPKNGTIAVRRDTIFRWNSVVGAPLYQVQITQDSLFFAASLDTLVFATQVKYSLEHSVRYFWRVRALTGSGEFGQWSEVWRIRRLVPSPQLLLPPNKAEGLPVEMNFVWAAPIAGLKYRLQVSHRPDFQPIILDLRDIPDTVYSTILPKSGEIYYWRVQWMLSDGASDWSAARSFATVVGIPRQDSPGNGVTGVNLNPTISWNSVSNAIYYHLQLSKEPDFTSPVFNDSTMPAVSRAMKNLDPLTRYFWRVRTVATAGKSPWSEIWEFVTGENPTGTEEAAGETPALVIVPNPATDVCRVELTPQTGAILHIEVCDATGGIVWKNTTENSPQTGAIIIPTAGLAAGIYRLRLISGTVTHSATLVIVR